MTLSAGMAVDMTGHFGDAELRRSFAQWPAGVMALAALIDGRPHGLAASSFTPVSLAPPMVLVCIGQDSTSWPHLREASRIGFSLLSSDQADACARLARSSGDKFTDLVWTASDSGAVYIDGASLELECEIADVVQAGDHHVVLFTILRLGTPRSAPLLYYRSSFVPDALIGA